jgi:antitoxin ParD1/3/4
MMTINVSLPKTLCEFVERRTKISGYETASQYVRQLIRDDQKRLRALKHKLHEGLSSGDPIEIDEGYWAGKRSALKSRAGNKARKS